VVTDSIPLPEDRPARFTLLSVDTLLTDAIKIIAEGGSISSLFKV
jgi:ribose-phosphate pyrophosphokinase